MEVVNDIQILCDEYIQTLDNSNDIKLRQGLFIDMLKYLYQNYVAYLLHNNDLSTAHRYNDVKLLYKLWNTYTSLAYRYKPKLVLTLNEYSIFTNINRDTLYEWLNGRSQSPEHTDMVKRFKQEIENSCLNDTSVFSMFRLKCEFGYIETAPIRVDALEKRTEASQLPDFMSTNAIIDTNATEV